jgi:hypothetical protein
MLWYTRFVPHGVSSFATDSQPQCCPSIDQRILATPSITPAKLHPTIHCLTAPLLGTAEVDPAGAALLPPDEAAC